MCLRILYLLFFNCVILLVTHGDSRDPPILPPNIGAVIVWTDLQMYEVDVQTIYYDSTVDKGFYMNHKAGETDLLIFDYKNNDCRVINLERNTCQRYSDNSTKLINPKYFFADMTSNLEFVNATKINNIIDGFTYSSETKNHWIEDGKVLKTFAHPNWTFPHPFNGTWSRPLTSEFTTSINQNLFNHSFYFMDVTDTIPANIFVPPPMVQCPVFKSEKRNVPALMDEFQVEAEYYDMTNQKYQVKIYVNAIAQVLREENRVVEKYDNFYYATFITDATFGILYTFDNANDKCLRKTALITGAGTNSSQLILNSAHAALFKYDLESLEYVGDRDCGYGDCEVWANSYSGDYHEIYWKRSTQIVDGVMQNVDIPVRMVESSPNYDHDQSANEFRGQSFYFNYEPKYPEWSVFDITDCYDDTDKLRFQIQFLGDYFTAGSILNFEKAFLKRIANLTYLPAIRIHRIRVDTLVNAYVVVTATLLEDPQNTGFAGAIANKMKYHYTNDEIYRKVSDAVSSKSFNVIVKNDTGNNITFTAQYITKDILSDEKIDQLSSSLVKFTREEHKSIAPRSTDLTIQATTVDECARQCERGKSSMCDMFTYCRSTSSCVLTSKNDNQETFLNTDCDLYTRQYEYDYHLFKGFRIANGPGDYSVETEDLRVCFRDCFRRQNDTYTCHSIEFCSDGTKHSCTYHAKHFVQSSITDIVPDASCLHYSQNFIQMYHMFPGMKWKNDNLKYAVIKRDIGASECAQSCSLDPAGCIDFEMCQPMEGFGLKTECRLYEPLYDSSNDPPSYVVASDCDHYRFKGIKTKFNFDNLGTTDASRSPSDSTSEAISGVTDESLSGSPVAPTNEAVSGMTDESLPGSPVAPTNEAVSGVTDESLSVSPVAPTGEAQTSAGGYGPGDMAGLGIAMLFIGGIAGFGLIHFYTKHQATTGNDQNIVLQIIRN